MLTPQGGAAGRLPAHYTATGSASFVDFLSAAAPDLLPGRRPLPPGVLPDVPHATTIVALTFDGGVLMAGDRRATAGNLIAQRDIVKVFPADDASVIGFAGTAGIAVELTRLFQVELEHYEKLNGTPLTLDGKANRLAAMVRGNLGLAMQGLAAVPLFAGYDHDARSGRIFGYDATGGRYEEHGYEGVGSGSLFAKSALKKRWRPRLDRDAAVRVAVESLYDAADDDSATGGPDVSRGLYPTVVVVDEHESAPLSHADAAAVAQAVVAERRENPGG